MHIALKKIKYDLLKFLPKGSEEQIEDIYNIAKDEFEKTEKGKTLLGKTQIPESQNQEIDNIEIGTAVKKTGRPKKTGE